MELQTILPKKVVCLKNIHRSIKVTWLQQVMEIPMQL